MDLIKVRTRGGFFWYFINKQRMRFCFLIVLFVLKSDASNILLRSIVTAQIKINTFI